MRSCTRWSGSATSAARRSRSSWRWSTTSGGTATGRSAPVPGTRASRPRASSRSALPRSSSPSACRSCWCRSPTSPTCSRRRSRSWWPPRSTSSGTRCGASGTASGSASAPRRRRPAARRRRAGARGRPQVPEAQDQGAVRLPAHLEPGHPDREPRSEGRGREAHPRACAVRLRQAAAAVAGELLRQGPGARAGDDRRPPRRGGRDVDGPAGGVEDGARLRGGVRGQGERAVRVAAAVPAVPRAVRVPPPAAPAAAPRHAHAARLRRVALLLQPRRHRHVRAARLPRPRLPAAAPPLGGLLRRAPGGPRPPGARGLRRGPLVPYARTTWLALALVFLVGFRIALNVADSNVIDVGYAGVIGADRIEHGHGLYTGRFPKDNEHGDAYCPVDYLLYVPFEAALPWSGKWDDLPAAHGAAIFFDLMTIL